MIIRFSKKARRALRRIYGGVGAAIAAVTFGACDLSLHSPGYAAYGPRPPCHVHEETGCVFISGRVVAKGTGRPITGIAVWVDDETSRLSLTRWDGYFSFHLQRQESYTLVFTDIDADENGLFAQKTVKLAWDDIPQDSPYLDRFFSLGDVELEAKD